jgi:putative transport protein
MLYLTCVVYLVKAPYDKTSCREPVASALSCCCHRISSWATLRQIGLVFFLAGIGTRAGYGFLSTFSKGGGVTLFVVGAAITFTATALHLWIGHRLLRIPMSILTGMVAGLFTQPAVLGYALEQTDNDLPNLGFASVYPVAMIAKILLVQAILSFNI